jgi:YHS domain-containing protein
MRKILTASAVTGAVLFGLATAAYAVTGQFGGLCTEGLALHKQIHTDCSINATYAGETYCFGSKKAKVAFFKNPAANLAKAKAYYMKVHG